MITGFKIGDVEIKKTAALAPMASVSDRAYRHICKNYNVGYMVTEMVSAKAIYYNDPKTFNLISIDSYEYPIAIQLFGDDVKSMVVAAQIISKSGCQIIDINMGCPVPKIAGKGSGAYLMKDIDLAYKIVKNVVCSVSLPVTVKIRKGWDSDSVNAIEFSIAMQQAGASAIAIHGRTRQQMYKSAVDLDIIRSVKQAVKIPVIGNGDITDLESALHMYDYTGCDLVMIGRGSYGNPWIFDEIYRYFGMLPVRPTPNLAERLNIMQQHVELMVKYKGENIGIIEARKHILYYLKGLKNSANYRRMACQINTFNDVLDLKKFILLENV